MVLSVVFSAVSFLVFLGQLFTMSKGGLFYFTGLCQVFAGNTGVGQCATDILLFDETVNGPSIFYVQQNFRNLLVKYRSLFVGKPDTGKLKQGFLQDYCVSLFYFLKNIFLPESIIFVLHGQLNTHLRPITITTVKLWTPH